jgi:hypothetical protein
MSEMNSAGVRKRHTPFFTVVVLGVSLVFLAVLSPVALAAPKGIFARFAQCPTSVPGSTLCEYDEITSGELAVGSVKVPIDKPIIFQSGGLPTGVHINQYFVLPAVNGETVSLTKLDVPGGLRTVLGCTHDRDRRDLFRYFRHDACAGGYGERADAVTATIEPVANQSNPAILDVASLILEDGTTLTFPGRVHLQNPVLGEACYLGSEAHPIVLNLTDAVTAPPPPNQPITGKLGELRGEHEGGYESDVITGNTLVDNAFSVPPAEGCGGSHASVIDPMIDRALGLESPAGHNTAILTGSHWVANAEAVLASEQFPTTEKPPPPHHHHHTGHHWWRTH